MVFIDVPPMLCFAEPMQIACAADSVLMVCRAGETSHQAVAEILASLRRLRVNVLGLVLNRVQHNMSSTYQPYQPYQSYYRKLERADRQTA